VSATKLTRRGRLSGAARGSRKSAIYPQAAGSGASARPFLRFTLVLFSLLGIVSSLLTGNQIEPDSVSSLVLTAFETGVSAYASQWIYVLTQAYRPLNPF
jgi:hypothetical protein